MAKFKNIDSLMKSYGFSLYRSKNHLIWKDKHGTIITTSKTPNGTMAIKQVERTIKKVLSGI